MLHGTNEKKKPRCTVYGTGEFAT